MDSNTRSTRNALTLRDHETLAAAAFTVEEFCRAHRISRATVYNLWRDGNGPRRMKVRDRTLVSVEAASDWRRQMEAAAADAA
jgi:hypothetical protein